MQSWLPEEEDRQRLREDGFGVLRIRDRYEFDETGICRENYFELSNADMREAGSVMAMWGYGSTRPMNTLPNEGFQLGGQLSSRWVTTLADPCEEAVIQLIQQGGRECSGALWSNSGTTMRIFWCSLKLGELPFAAAMRAVLFNDVLTLLEGEELSDERAQWWLNQGIPGVLIRFQRDGLSFWRERGLEIPDLRKPEGDEEALARRMLFDPGEMGRMFRDLIEQDLTRNLLELGIEQLLGKTTPTLKGRARSIHNAGLGDWLLEPWWAMAEAVTGDTVDSHIACAQWRNHLREEMDAPHPLFEFELTDDDRELIRHWVLQHRARLLTGRWEYSPAWAFYPVPITIFWMHGLIESDVLGFREHNDWQMVLAYELVTEHMPDVESRWVPNDSSPPRANALDWRFQEVILPEVERMAEEFCESVGVATTMTSDSRWSKLFRFWEHEGDDPNAYEASLLKKDEVIPLALDLIREGGLLEVEEALTQEDAEGLIEWLAEESGKPGILRWCAGQGWNELVNMNELIGYGKTQC